MLDLLTAFLSIDFPIIYTLRIIAVFSSIVFSDVSNGDINLFTIMIIFVGSFLLLVTYWAYRGAFSERTQIHIQQDTLRLSQNHMSLNRQSATLNFDEIYNKIKMAAIFNIFAPFIATVWLVDYFGDDNLALLALIWGGGFGAVSYAIDFLIYGGKEKRQALLKLSKGLDKAAKFESGTVLLAIFVGLAEIGGRAMGVN